MKTRNSNFTEQRHKHQAVQSSAKSRTPVALKNVARMQRLRKFEKTKLSLQNKSKFEL
jgi:hypothetical protein